MGQSLVKNLACWVRKNEISKSLSFDMKLLTQTETLADELSVVLTTANGVGANSNSSILTRDRTYTYMKQALDKIHYTDQYVFWRDKDRKKGYVSIYHKKQ